MAVLAPAEGPILEQILDASYSLWHQGLSRRGYGRFYAAQRATSWGRAHIERYALVDGDRVRASGKLYFLDAALDGRPTRVAGLGAIFTQPEHRGRGAGRELIDRLLDLAARRGADLALLFSEIGSEYYARIGFAPIATSLQTLVVVEDVRRGAPATMVRAGEERDLGDVVSMGAALAASYRFHLERDRDLVQFAIAKNRLAAGLAQAGTRELMFFIAEEGASAAAYVVIGVKGREWTILECGDRDPAAARVGAILQVLVARDPAEARPTISGWLPSGFVPPQIDIVDRRPAHDVMMVRPLTAPAAAARALREHEILYWRGDLF